MTRGAYNEKLPSWIQEFAGINRVSVDSNPEEYTDNSIYAISYGSDQIILEERRGSLEEVATLISGDADRLEDLVDQTEFYLDTDRRSRAVLMK